MDLIMADGSIEPVPDDHIIAQLSPAVGPRYLPLHGITLGTGALWHFAPEEVDASALFEAVPDEQITELVAAEAKRSARGRRGQRASKDGEQPQRIRTNAGETPDPVTGQEPSDYRELGPGYMGGQPQPAAELDEDGNPIKGTVAEEE